MKDKLDALSTDAELPFGRPRWDLDDRYEPPPVNPPEESVIHYGPGDWPLCREERLRAAYTADPHQISGCDECIELVAEDLGDDNKYRGHCLHCW